MKGDERMAEYEIDYKALFEQIKKRFDDLINSDEEYFKLLKTSNELKPYAELVGKHFLDFKKTEQVNVLRILVSYGHICKSLCEKYQLESEEDADV